MPPLNTLPKQFLFDTPSIFGHTLNPNTKKFLPKLKYVMGMRFWAVEDFSQIRPDRFFLNSMYREGFLET